MARMTFLGFGSMVVAASQAGPPSSPPRSRSRGATWDRSSSEVPSVTFYLLQSAYAVWTGILLGEVRRTTGSWSMSWLGHFGYNVAVLYLLRSLSA